MLFFFTRGIVATLFVFQKVFVCLSVEVSTQNFIEKKSFINVGLGLTQSLLELKIFSIFSVFFFE